MIWNILYIIDALLFAIVASTVIYMTVYAIASQFMKKQEIPKAKRLNRFIILIPSYKLSLIHI